MDPKLLLLATLVTLAVFTSVSSAKPISLVDRCRCRTVVSSLIPRTIHELRILQTPNCPIQIIAKLKNKHEVCVNPEIKWLRQYLKNALNKAKNFKKEQQTN